MHTLGNGRLPAWISCPYRRHRFPPPIIQHAIWLYLRFTLSYRDVEELLAERGLEVSYESVRPMPTPRSRRRAPTSRILAR
jgi:transposase-like protein